MTTNLDELLGVRPVNTEPAARQSRILAVEKCVRAAAFSVLYGLRSPGKRSGGMDEGSYAHVAYQVLNEGGSREAAWRAVVRKAERVRREMRARSYGPEMARRIDKECAKGYYCGTRGWDVTKDLLDAGWTILATEVRVRTEIASVPYIAQLDLVMESPTGVVWPVDLKTEGVSIARTIRRLGYSIQALGGASAARERWGAAAGYAFLFVKKPRPSLKIRQNRRQYLDECRAWVKGVGRRLATAEAEREDAQVHTVALPKVLPPTLGARVRRFREVMGRERTVEAFPESEPACQFCQYARICEGRPSTWAETVRNHYVQTGDPLDPDPGRLTDTPQGGQGEP